MAVWCFVCDRPVEGEMCPGCGRPATVVEDSAETSPSRSIAERLSRVPRSVWIVVAVVAIVVLFAILQSGFRLE